MVATGLRDLPITSIEEENLDVTPYVESLAQFAMECDTPMTIAIQGDWGSGKTSMMNLIRASIEASHPDRMYPIWFNTWQYSQFNAQDHLGISLLSRFATEVSGPSNTGDRVKKLIGTVAKSLARNVAFVGTMAATGSAEGAKDAQAAVDEVFAKDFVQSLTELKDSIVRMTLDRLTKDNKDRIVVFIDDLDRLVPERAVDLLEVFKLFLDVPGCVFILACDYQVIAQGLKAKFNIGEADLKGKSFFDKIIQLPFSMPVGQYDTRRYTGDLLTKIGISATAIELDKYRHLIATSVGLNPRSMKRLFNAFQLINLAATKKGVLKATDVAQHAERQRILLACLCLQTAFEPVYNFLVGLGPELSEEKLTALLVIDQGVQEDLQTLIDDMGGARSPMMSRLPDFIEAFLDAVQLESDDDDKSLSPSELNNLVDILSFSSITATNAPTRSQDASGKDSVELKVFLQGLAAELNQEYEQELQAMKDEIKVSGLSRKGRARGYLTSANGLLIDRKRVSITCEYRDRGETPWAGVYLSANQFDWLCALAERSFATKALYQKEDKIERDDRRYYLGYQEFPDDLPTDEKLKAFEDMVRKCLKLAISEFYVIRSGKAVE